MNVALKENERIDDLHRKGYKLIQNPERFCFGIDAVLLSGYAKAKKDETVLDLCSGNGIIPILMEAKTECNQFVAVEIQSDNVDMARRSIRLNNLQDKICALEADVNSLEGIFKQGSFDVITCNPPYMPVGTGYINDYSPKAIARHEIMCNIQQIMRVSSKMLKYGGRMYMIHRPNRLADIFAGARENKLEPKSMKMVQSYINKEPSMVLLEFAKNGKPMLNVEAPLIIYMADGTYTKEVREIYYE